MYSLKAWFVQVCAKFPSQGSEPFDWKLCNNTKHNYEIENLGVRSICWKTYVFSLKDKCHSEKMRVRLDFIKGCIAFFHIVSSGQLFWKNKKKISFHLRYGIKGTWEEGWAPQKDVFHLSTFIFFCKNSVFYLIQGTILSSRQIATCKQHVPSTAFFQGML